MQILNITPTIRPSKSLTTQMYTPFGLDGVCSKGAINGIVLKQALHDVSIQEVCLSKGVIRNAVLREPLIKLDQPLVGHTLSTGGIAKAVLRTTLISSAQPLVGHTLSTGAITGASLRTALISTVQPLVGTVISKASISIKLT